MYITKGIFTIQLPLGRGVAFTADATDLVIGVPTVEPYAQTVLALATKIWLINVWNKTKFFVEDDITFWSELRRWEDLRFY